MLYLLSRQTTSGKRELRELRAPVKKKRKLVELLCCEVDFMLELILS